MQRMKMMENVLMFRHVWCIHYCLINGHLGVQLQKCAHPCTQGHSYLENPHLPTPYHASVCRRGWCFGWTLWPAAEQCAVPHTVFVPREGAQEGPGVDVPQVDPPVAAAGV